MKIKFRVSKRLLICVMVTLGILNINGCELLTVPDFGSEEIYIIGIESGEETLLAERSVDNPQHSPTENRIVYSNSFPAEEGLYTMNTDGAENVRISTREASLFIEWSPDGDKIAFSSGKYIYILDGDGTNCERIYEGPSSIYRILNTISWSPDSKKVVFDSRSTIESEKIDLFMINVETKELKCLVSGLTDFADPCWSPVSDEIVYSTGESLVLIDTSGSQEVNLAKGKEPKWSPDASKISFVSEEAFWTMDSDGSNISKLVEREEWISYPYRWSPDGTKIAYSEGMASGGGPRPIYIIDIANITKTNLVNGTNPSWSPDGGKVVYLKRFY